MITATTLGELDEVLARAAQAKPVLAALSGETRARALRQVADALDAAAGELVPLAHWETHLPVHPRLPAELGRTTFQLRLLAEVIADGGYLEATLDSPDSCWPAGGRADVRRMLVPVGPVVVFAAGNFPFAFSVAGGDTAAALAVGCPVVLKAHPGHPELSARTGEIVSAALTDLPAGAFAVVYGEEAGRAAVLDPRVRAGAFTGSLAGGRALFDLACSRPDPIPFYAEMGSVNPVFLTESAARSRPAEIVEGYVGSFTLGAGQFCTKPGLLFVPDAVADDIESRLVDAVSAVESHPLLSDRVADGYAARLASLRAHQDVRVLSSGAATVLATTAPALLAHHDSLAIECFGPASMVVRYRDDAELLRCARKFTGELTASVHGELEDVVAPTLLAELSERAGRVLWNGWPTGVAVTYAMHHGGPYPATTAPAHTSVGTTSLRRFQRPVCYQNMPQALLPEALRDGNPLSIPRRLDGVRSR